MKEKKLLIFSSSEAKGREEERKILTAFDGKGITGSPQKRSKNEKTFDSNTLPGNSSVDYTGCKQSPVRQVVEVDLPTKFGHFRLILYESAADTKDCQLVIVKGDLNRKDPLLVRIHSECLTGDMFGSLRCDCGDQLFYALKRIEQEGSGALLYLRQEGRGIGLRNKLLAYKLQEKGKDTVEANEALGFKADLREYWVAAQILKDLSIDRIRLMTNNPKKIEGITKYGIEVVERVPVIVHPTAMNENYLKTKKKKLGHLFPF